MATTYDDLLTRLTQKAIANAAIRKSTKAAADDAAAFQDAAEAIKDLLQFKTHASIVIAQVAQCEDVEPNALMAAILTGDLLDLLAPGQTSNAQIGVKPLEWKDAFNDGAIWQASDAFGEYEVNNEDGDGWVGTFYETLIVSAGKEIAGENTTFADDIGYPTKEEAMAKIEEWRTRHILSLLIAKPAPDTVDTGADHV